MIEVDTDGDPVTVIVYVPAGVPFGLVVPPPPPVLALEPQPIAKNAIKKTIIAIEASATTRRLPIARMAKTEIPKTIKVPSHK